MNIGATRQAASAASPVDMAKVSEETNLILIPTSFAPSGFCATASIVLPNVVFLIKSCTSTIKRKAIPITKSLCTDIVIPNTSTMSGYGLPIRWPCGPQMAITLFSRTNRAPKAEINEAMGLWLRKGE